MNAPVIVFTYNRYYEAMRVMEALSNNLLAKETIVYVFSNAPMEDKIGDDEAVEKVRMGLKEYKKCFKEYHLILRKKNTGSNDNMIDGIGEVVACHGRAIILEDDIVTAKCFLNFMNQALDKYENEKDVFSISAYNPVTIETDLPGDSFSYDAFRSWGWGIWRDRWESFDKSEDTISRIDLRKAHEEGLMYISTIRYDIVHRSHNNPRYLDYWLACKQMAEKQTVIYSKKSLCDNIGLIDNSETSSTCPMYKNDNFDMNYVKEEFELSRNKLNSDTDYKYFTGFRWNEFAMDMYFEDQYNRASLYSSMYYSLALIMLNGKKIDYYFKKYNIKSIGIYGWGESGRLLFDLCKKAEINVAFILDQRRLGKCEVPTYVQYDNLPNVDIIVVSAIRDFTTIEEKLHVYVTSPLVCMDDLIAECKVDLLDNACRNCNINAKTEVTK